MRQNYTMHYNKCQITSYYQFSNNRLIALQAVEVGYDSEGGHSYAIITDNRVLMSLLEILIWQKTAC